MFDKFQQMGQQVSQLKKIRDQAVQMQKQLQAEVIEVEEENEVIEPEINNQEDNEVEEELKKQKNSSR